jgi:hypothetical protein
MNTEESMSKELSRAIVVFTDKRGVFFGYPEGSTEGDRIRLRDCRMCVYWSAATRGAWGLAATGPADGSRITKPVPLAEVRGVTAVLNCSDEARRCWEDAPWG